MKNRVDRATRLNLAHVVGLLLANHKTPHSLPSPPLLRVHARRHRNLRRRRPLPRRFRIPEAAGDGGGDAGHPHRLPGRDPSPVRRVGGVGAAPELPVTRSQTPRSSCSRSRRLRQSPRHPRECRLPLFSRCPYISFWFGLM